MKRIHGILIAPMLAIAALSLAGCGAATTPPPATASTSPPPSVVAPLGDTLVDDQAIVFGYQALETIASASDFALSTGALKAGSPQAVAIADGLHGTLQWLNTASALQKAGQATSAFAAWQQAKAGLANLRTALGMKP